VDNHFGIEMAKGYDVSEDTPERRAELAKCVKVLHRLAEGGSVLEFAVGTGRIALPLSATGLLVTGIELSPAMLAVLRRKPGAEALTLAQGDMAKTRLDNRFQLVFLVYNTIGNLTTQAAQVACFRNAAGHLVPGGRFVVENIVPPLRRFPPGSAGVTFATSPDHTGIDVIDTATQSLVSHHYTRAPNGVLRHSEVPQRYTWPAELDLMAALAGLELEHRWGDWDRQPFDDTCDKHVSVWRLAP
jgi:SAM-dependent methyltransferase